MPHQSGGWRGKAFMPDGLVASDMPVLVCRFTPNPKPRSYHSSLPENPKYSDPRQLNARNIPRLTNAVTLKT
jgi:hypothetical protein